ncbi:hypothetical protein AC1031_003644 [Aphanomyces cochlioides]|nr:hypothetical protein AC1031_003644 [Aphanomyces cochlioides]
MQLPQHEPLHENFFQCPRLEPHELEELRAMAVQNSMDLYAKSRIYGGQRNWTLCEDNKDVKIYKSEDLEHVPKWGRLFMYAATSEVVATIEEFVGLFKNDTTIQAKEFSRRFISRAIDSLVLYSVLKPTKQQPHEKVSIIWRAYAPTMGGKLVQNRDNCILECHHEFSVGTRRGWIYSLVSIDLASCPNMEDRLGLVRVRDYGTGYVVLESARRPGYLDVTYVNHADVNVGKKEWFLNSLGQKTRFAGMALMNLCRHTSKIDQFLREDRLARTPFLSVNELVPLDSVGACNLCSKKFRPWSKRLNCWKCGMVTCRNCNRPWMVKQKGYPTLTDICTKCSLCRPIDKSTQSRGPPTSPSYTVATSSKFDDSTSIASHDFSSYVETEVYPNH